MHKFSFFHIYDERTHLITFSRKVRYELAGSRAACRAHKSRGAKANQGGRVQNTKFTKMQQYIHAHVLSLLVLSTYNI